MKTCLRHVFSYLSARHTIYVLCKNTKAPLPRVWSGDRKGGQAMFDYAVHRLFDGGMGTMLQKAGLEAGQSPERLNRAAPETI